ncbi:MAG: BLUF domain-containing protein [Octadecabacter sp.]|nr:BLUF domain-containing protein [Octadecabacter sp.]
MTFKQIIYASQPFGYDDSTLGAILLDARRCNKRDGITGALVCRPDIYLQLLEGPDAAVEAAYGRISRDDRHANINRLVDQTVTDRMLGQWEMLHDPATSWLWSAEDVADGALERATPEDITAVFRSLEAKAKAAPQT